MGNFRCMLESILTEHILSPTREIANLAGIITIFGNVFKKTSRLAQHQCAAVINKANQAANCSQYLRGAHYSYSSQRFWPQVKRPKNHGGLF